MDRRRAGRDRHSRRTADCIAPTRRNVAKAGDNLGCACGQRSLRPIRLRPHTRLVSRHAGSPRRPIQRSTTGPPSMTRSTPPTATNIAGMAHNTSTPSFLPRQDPRQSSWSRAAPPHDLPVADRPACVSRCAGCQRRMPQRHTAGVRDATVLDRPPTPQTPPHAQKAGPMVGCGMPPLAA